MSYLAIDPGQDSGWCTVSEGGAVLDCGLNGLPSCSSRVCIERPQVYAARHSKGNPNDLITLAIQVGRYQERYERQGAKVLLVLPHLWKGTIPKDVHHARIMKDLPEACRAVVVDRLAKVVQSKRHNVIDAVGLALWAFSRGRGHFA